MRTRKTMLIAVPVASLAGLLALVGTTSATMVCPADQNWLHAPFAGLDGSADCVANTSLGPTTMARGILTTEGFNQLHLHSYLFNSSDVQLSALTVGIASNQPILDCYSRDTSKNGVWSSVILDWGGTCQGTTEAAVVASSVKFATPASM